MHRVFVEQRHSFRLVFGLHGFDVLDRKREVMDHRFAGLIFAELPALRYDQLDKTGSIAFRKDTKSLGFWYPCGS